VGWCARCAADHPRAGLISTPSSPRQAAIDGRVRGIRKLVQATWIAIAWISIRPAIACSRRCGDPRLGGARTAPGQAAEPPRRSDPAPGRRQGHHRDRDQCRGPSRQLAEELTWRRWTRHTLAGPAPVVRLDRAPVFESVGRPFKSAGAAAITGLAEDAAPFF